MASHDAPAIIIASASGGRSLRGVDPQYLLRRGDEFEQTTSTPTASAGNSNMGKQLLLKPPSGVPLMGPDKAFMSNAYCFSSFQQSSNFSKDVINKGWTLATAVHAHFVLGSASALLGTMSHDHQLTQERGQHELSEACIIHCVYVPTRSFQIPRENMTLSNVALERARAIKSVMDADEFLKMFNPFVSQGLYHLGGVFFKQITVKLSGAASLSEILSQMQKEVCGKAEAMVLLMGGEGVGAGSGASHHNNKERLVSETTSLKVQERMENVMICGPTTAQTSLEEFQRIMAMGDPSCWSIIDQDVDDEGSLVAVWELLENPSHNPAAAEDDMTFKRAAMFLCERWMQLHKVAASSSHCGDVPAVSVQDSLQHLLSKLMIKGDRFLHSMTTQKWQPDSGPAPFPLVLIRRSVTLTDLLRTLKSFTDSKGSDKATVMDHIQQFIRSKSMAESANELADSKALGVLSGWGFDMNSGIHSQDGQLDASSIGQIAEELEEEILLPPQPCEHSKFTSTVWRDPVADMRALWQPMCNEEDANSTFRCVGDVVLDRNNEYLLTPPSSIHEQPTTTNLSMARRYIDCLRHRLKPPEHLFLAQLPCKLQNEKVHDWDAAFAGEEEDEEEIGEDTDEEAEEGTGAPTDVTVATAEPSERLQARKVAPLEILVDIFQHSELPLQIELCRLLLSQRASALLAFPRASARSSAGQTEVPLSQCIDAFGFTKVGIQDEKKLQIHEDVQLPRVVFISDREHISRSHSATIASRVMQCDFISQHDRRDMNDLSQILPVIEVGVGFIGHGSPKTPIPWLCFHVTGPYRHPDVIAFVETIADIVVLELNEGQECYTTRAFWQREQVQKCAKVVQWREKLGDEDEDFDAKRMFIWGQETYIVEQLGKSLHVASKRMSQRARMCLTEACTRHFILPRMHQPRNLKVIDEFFMRPSCDLSEMRQKLLLQKSLVIEGEAFLTSLRLNHDPLKKRAEERICRKQKEFRKQSVEAVMTLPIVQLFHQILSQNDALSRTVGIMSLENSISEGMQQKLADLARAVDQKYMAYARGLQNDMTLKNAYIEAKQEYIEKSIGIDNIWRELCHIFEADPSNQRGLATLAAQHLLDGFPLEIFDGDAGMYCKTWVETVLTELHGLLLAKSEGKAAPKLFVLSVMGLQSSGKSTMLNLMFGTRLPTSAGRCTRGVFMQLVPSERAEYEYVMLLDTEGLRSHEFHGVEDSVARDNRLATFGLLPADASILMVSNEDDGALKDVLPMVLLAFRSSSIGERCGGRIKAKMFFVYRSVDTNDKSKLKGNKQKLHECLMEAAKEVSRIAGESSSVASAAEADSNWLESSATISNLILSDLQVEEEKEEEKGSDVWFMGNLKRGHVPPTDTPEWNYGMDVLKLREHIHKRVCGHGWEATNPAALAKVLSLVWDCICSADFELNFRSRVEYNSFMELQKALQPLKTGVAQKHLEAFHDLEKAVRGMERADLEANGEDGSSRKLVETWALKINGAMDEESEKAKQMLQQPRWAKWRVSTLEEWDRNCRDMGEWYKRRVEDLESGVLRYEKVVADYESRCKATIAKSIDEGEWRLGEQDREELEKKFEEIFQSILEDAAWRHPRMAERVRGKVLDRYRSHGICTTLDQFHMQPDDSTGSADYSEQPAPVMMSICDSGGMILAMCSSKFVKFRNKHFPNLLGGSSDMHAGKNRQLSLLLSKLEKIVDHNLRDAKQFSEVLVDNVIVESRHVIHVEDSGFMANKSNKEIAHQFVADNLAFKLTEIQRQWDADHNVAEKLQRSAKPRLFRFFMDKAMGMETTALLIRDLQHILEDELKDAHTRAVVKVATIKVGQEDWAMDWREMRNLLDFHLLILMEKGKHKDIQRLIEYVRDESQHFQRVSDALMGQFVKPKMVESEWKRLVQGVEACFKLARATIQQDREFRAFIEVFHRLLEDRVESELAAVVRESTSNQAHYSSSSTNDGEGIELDAEFYEKKLPELCRTLQAKPVPEVDLSNVVQKVKKQMEGLGNEHYKPKCSATCPRCGSSCFYPMGHPENLHDCVHQPCGLNGGVWQGSNILCEKTCLQHMEACSGMVFDAGNRMVTFVDFEKEYPGWKRPGASDRLSMHVRESIFFRYQPQLSGYYSRMYGKGKANPCHRDVMPDRYDHDIQHLRAELYNKLKTSKHGASADDLVRLLSNV